MKVMPITFQPFFKPVIWGGDRLREHYGEACPSGPVGEAWLVSARAGAESRVDHDSPGPHAGRPLSQVVASDPEAWLGREVVQETGPAFPLLIKIIDAARDLSVQVHPDPSQAREHGGDIRTKTECWWILDAGPDARLFLGLPEDTSEEDLRAAIEAGTLENHLVSHPVKPGDFFFVPTGAVHAIGADILLLEIQETSDTTYRLFDWGRLDADGQPRPLHVEEGLRAARHRPRGAGRMVPTADPEPAYTREQLVACREFVVERWRFDLPASACTDGRRFHLAVVTEGAVYVEANGRISGPYPRWTPILLPAALGDYTLRPAQDRAAVVVTAPGPQWIHPEVIAGVRLQKVLAQAGVGSRRECEKIIADGRVMVDGMVVQEMGTRVNPSSQDIRVDGERLGGSESKVYYLLYKPRGVVCTNHDEQNRPRAVDYVPGETRRIYTIGRLDVDSEGAILLTNDGELAFEVSHPRFGLPKVYLVQVRGLVQDADVEKIQSGIWLSDGRVGGIRVQILRRQTSTTWLRVTLREGKNRGIRRVFARTGYPVKSLKRVRIGNLSLKGLKPGEVRNLSPDDIEGLRAGSVDRLPDLPARVDEGFLPRWKPSRSGSGPRSRRPSARRENRTAPAGPGRRSGGRMSSRPGKRGPGRGPGSSAPAAVTERAGAGRGVDRSRPGRPTRPGRPGPRGRATTTDRGSADRPSRPGRPGQRGRATTTDRGSADRPNRPGRPTRPGRPGQRGRATTTDRGSADRPNRPGRPTRPGRPGQRGRATTTDRGSAGRPGVRKGGAKDLNRSNRGVKARPGRGRAAGTARNTPRRKRR